MDQAIVPFDSRRFRHVLGHFPTGVVVVTAIDASGLPTGMSVGSFTSVSLNPPLVSFLPDQSSTTFPAIREAGSFCVNILSDHQQHVARLFSLRGVDRFGSITWTPASSGAPKIDGAVAWIDCDIDVIYEAGDHYVVIGQVRDLDTNEAAGPLIFFQGGYGGFSSDEG